MSQYPKARQWISKAITMVMFANFYYVIGVLCWAVIAPDQGSFIRAFQHGGLFVNALYWGGLFGCYLGFSGLSSATFNARKEFKQRRFTIKLKEAFDYCICASFIIAPLLVIKSHLFIRAIINPQFFMLLTVFFLVALTYRYLRIQRMYDMHKVVARA